MQYSRIVSLIGKNKFNILKNKKIIIVGIGGVGGYVFETLIRSGINNIDIIDPDKIDITNLNRQLIANLNNIDKYKADEAKIRALSINPNVNINVYKIFLDKNNIERILNNKYDYIIDACDTIDTKLEIIKYSQKNNIKLISCLGTAKKIDPLKLKITELSKTSYDPIAKILRKKVKELKITEKIIVVSSEEKPLECKSLGSLMIVPASAGILCASYIINDILKGISE